MYINAKHPEYNRLIGELNVSLRKEALNVLTKFI